VWRKRQATRVEMTSGGIDGVTREFCAANLTL
jgi:hypothetical protein